MNVEQKPALFTEEDLKRVKENKQDYDRHFLPKPEKQQDDSTKNK